VSELTDSRVLSDFVNAIDTEVVAQIGHGSSLRDYAWAGDAEDDEGDWPFVVVRDGREFEVDIDVHVIELTPEVKAKREADAKALMERLEGLQARAKAARALAEAQEAQR